MIHDVILWLVLAVIWIIPASLVARLARRRGYAFVPFMVAALIVPWPVVLVVALVLPRRLRRSD